MSGSKQRASSLGLGILLITLAFGFVAVMSAFGKGAAAVSTGAIVFFQNGISLVLFAPWFLRGGWSALKTSRLSLHLVRAAAGLLSQALMFAAVKQMPLVNAVLLSNSAPLFIPLVARVWLRERVSGKVWAGLLLGFAGVVVILRPDAALFTNPVALLALAAALCSAFALVSVNQLSKTEPARRVLFYYFLFSSLAAAPFAFYHWKTPHPREWLFLGGIGAAMALSQMLIILAYQHAQPAQIAPFNYTVVIFSGAIGWLVWGNKPDALALAGVLLVTAGGVLSTRTAGPATSGHFGWAGYWNHWFGGRETA